VSGRGSRFCGDGSRGGGFTVLVRLSGRFTRNNTNICGRSGDGEKLGSVLCKRNYIGLGRGRLDRSKSLRKQPGADSATSYVISLST